MEKREKLLEKIIKIYGFEHPTTIEFSELIVDEKCETKYLEVLSEILVRNPKF